MKIALLSFALVTGLACCPAAAADAGKTGPAHKAAAGRAPEGWHTGLIDGSIRLRPQPPLSLATAGPPPSALPLVAAARAPKPTRGNTPARPVTAEPGALPFAAAAFGVLTFLIVRLRRGA